MAKEHLEYTTAEDVDDLIDAISDLNYRLDKLRNQMLGRDDSDGYLATLKRSYSRLMDKKYKLLRALKMALSGMS
jgi:hypothetical protein